LKQHFGWGPPAPSPATLLLEHTFDRNRICPNYHLSETLLARTFIWPKLLLPEYTFHETTLTRTKTWPKLHYSERTLDRKVTFQKLHLIEMHLPEHIFARKSRDLKSFAKIYICSNNHLIEIIFARIFIW